MIVVFNMNSDKSLTSTGVGSSLDDPEDAETLECVNKDEEWLYA